MDVSISEAARLAGVSRTTLYNRYINTGKITVHKNKSNSSVIDTSEIYRVFGNIQGGAKQTANDITSFTPDDAQSKIDQLTVQLEHANALIAEKDARIADLRSALLLIEHNQKAQVLQASEQQSAPPSAPFQEQTEKKKQESAPSQKPTEEVKKPAPKPGLMASFRKWLNS